MKICDTFDISTLLEPTLKVTLNAFLLYSDCVHGTYIIGPGIVYKEFISETNNSQD